jgi:hypothetical protein
MPRSIDEGFRDFLSNLTPSDSESSAAKSHRASIEACLKANFDLKRFFRVGSFGNGTSISGYSDVDYFASIPRTKLQQNSSTTLTKVRDALANRFPNTGVRVNCPAVVVPFGTVAKESTEVVAADYVRETTGNHSVYEIPNCSDGWMESSPEAHNAYVRRIDAKLSSKVKPLIRFIKAWKFYQNVPVSSFYLELQVARYADGESSILYSTDVKRLLCWLDSNGLPKMQDPMGISGYISPCKTSAQLDDAKSKLATAATRATKAIDAESAGKISDAFDWWRLLYNNQFPSYYRT